MIKMIDSILARQPTIKYVSTKTNDYQYILDYTVDDKINVIAQVADKLRKIDPLIVVLSVMQGNALVYLHPLKLRELNTAAKDFYYQSLSALNPDNQLLHDYLINFERNY